MNDRLVTLACALAALLLTIFLLLPPPANEQIKKSLPSTEDRGINGLYGLKQWLQLNGISTFSLRQRYTDLQQLQQLPEQGNLLILSLPVERQLLDSEWPALATWISQGNTLLLMGSIYNQAVWTSGEDCFCDAKKLLAYFDWDLSSEDIDPVTNDDKLDSLNEAVDKSLKTRLPACKPM